MVLSLNLCKRGFIAARGIPTASEKGEERKQDEYDPDVHLRSSSIFIEKVVEKRENLHIRKTAADGNRQMGQAC